MDAGIAFFVGVVLGAVFIVLAIRRYIARDGTVADIIRQVSGIPKE